MDADEYRKKIEGEIIEVIEEPEVNSIGEPIKKPDQPLW